MSDLTTGFTLFSGDPSSATPVAANFKIPAGSRGWVYVHVKIAAHASDTCTVTMKGRLNANGSYVSLVKSDQSTAASVAQSAGGASETIFTCQLMPDMKIALSGTSTSGASCKVWIEAATSSSARSDS